MTIEPKILKGTRDFMPEAMQKRKYVMDVIERIFVKYGYDTIETPVIEYAETILGKYGDEGDKLVYSFEDNGGREIALRYDQTVPTARFVAANHNILPIPFKRYQISRVWRADKPQKGRYREFYQCDIDIIGTDSIISDAEISRIIYEVFTVLGIKNFVTKINTRRLTNAILKQVGISEPVPVIRALDKIDKIGEAGVRNLLSGIQNIDKVFGIIKNKDILVNMPEYEEINEFLEYSYCLGVPKECLQVDPFLARGLDYYTGVIFETMIKDINIGAVCGGGRYDNLCEMFSKERFPGTGVAFGFDRIMVAMEELGLLDDIKLNTDLLVTIFDSVENSLKLYNFLQKSSKNIELYHAPDKLKKQLKYADKKGVRYVAIQGDNELQDDTVIIKDLDRGSQETVSMDNVIDYVNGVL